MMSHFMNWHMQVTTRKRVITIGSSTLTTLSLMELMEMEQVIMLVYAELVRCGETILAPNVLIGSMVEIFGLMLEGMKLVNPGFLENADNITDLSTAEIFSCLTSSTDTFGDLRNQLKNKTNNDAQVDNAWNNYTDWP